MSSTRLHMHDDDDAGSAIVLVITGVVFLIATLLALARYGTRLLEHASATTAADAAALAGAHDGYPGAQALAEANGGSLTGYRDVLGVVTVQVQLGDTTATASASLFDG
jgi:hypothetical protein